MITGAVIFVFGAIIGWVVGVAMAGFYYSGKH